MRASFGFFAPIRFDHPVSCASIYQRPNSPVNPWWISMYPDGMTVFVFPPGEAILVQVKSAGVFAVVLNQMVSPILNNCKSYIRWTSWKTKICTHISLAMISKPVGNGDGTSMYTGSKRQFQQYPTTLFYFLSRLPSTLILSRFDLKLSLMFWDIVGIVLMSRSHGSVKTFAEQIFHSSQF